MKVLSLLIILIPSFVFAQNPGDEIDWGRILSADDIGSGTNNFVKTDHDGNTIVFKTCYGVVKLDHNPINGLPVTNGDAVLFKFDFSGNLLFSKVIPNSHEALDFEVDNLNNIFLNYGSAAFYYHRIIAKFGPTGNLLWKDSVMNEDINDGPQFHIAADVNGDLYYGGATLTGITVLFNNDSLLTQLSSNQVVDFFLLKISPTGQLIKSQLFSCADTPLAVTYLTSVSASKTSAGVYLGGRSYSNMIIGTDSIFGPFILNLDSDFNLKNKYLFSELNGTLLNVQKINFDENNKVYASILAGNDIVIIEDDTLNFPDYLTVLMKFDGNLNHTWHKFVQNLPTILVPQFTVNVSGSSYYSTRIPNDSIAIKLDPDGNFRWKLFFPGSQSSVLEMRSIACGKQHQMIGSGYLIAPVTLNGNYYLPISPTFMIYSFNDPDSLISVDEINQNNSFDLFPNPASSTFSIRSNSQFQNASIEIFNLLGEEVLNVEYKNPLTVDCEHFSPGLYFVKLQTENGNEIQKLLVK